MVHQQSFLVRVLLAVCFPSGRHGSKPVYESLVPIMSTVYGILINEDTVHRVISNTTVLYLFRCGLFDPFLCLFPLLNVVGGYVFLNGALPC